ncbi:MAG: orotate phosphoribosyltransferase [Albidovulum sp.]|nr:orotate phosphoribosyltransferase [Albidovulum sp.]
MNEARYECRAAGAIVASMLLEIDAVAFRPQRPFTLASGRPSPVYIDCRKLISYPRIRTELIGLLVAKVFERFGYEAFDNISGGETAGIPFAALVAERMGLPMSYVRKKPKGYGRKARIEGEIYPGQRVLLVEDLATDGGSKIGFVEAIRDTGANCSSVAVIFFYGIFPGTREKLERAGLDLLSLCSWRDILEAARRTSEYDTATLAEVEEFIDSPVDWQERILAG